MKTTRLLLAWAVSAAVAAAVSPSFAEVIPPPPPTGPVASAPLTPVDAIRVAADPSAAIQAYAAAMRADPNNTVAVDLAYIHRMVDFGLPEMADSQAQALVKRGTTEGLPWAVTAYMSAKKQDAPTALAQIAYAVSIADKDPFVVRTTGQIMAWYDIRVVKSQLNADTQKAALTARTLLSDKPEYQQAYTRAVQAYAEIAANDQPPATQNVPPEPAPAPADAPAPIVAQAPMVAGPVGYDPGYIGYAGYADPYYYAPIGYGPAYGAAWCPVGFYGQFWWPSFGFAIGFGCDNHHDHYHGYHDNYHGGHDNGHGSGWQNNGNWSHAHDPQGAGQSVQARPSFAPSRNFADAGHNMTHPMVNNSTAALSPTHSSSLVPHAGVTVGRASQTIAAASPAPSRSTFNWNTVRADMPTHASTFQPMNVSPNLSPGRSMPFGGSSLGAGSQMALQQIHAPTISGNPSPIRSGFTSSSPSFSASARPAIYSSPMSSPMSRMSAPMSTPMPSISSAPRISAPMSSGGGAVGAPHFSGGGGGGAMRGGGGGGGRR